MDNKKQKEQEEKLKQIAKTTDNPKLKESIKQKLAQSNKPFNK